MTTARVTSDVNDITRWLSDYQQKQVPYAVKEAINATAKLAVAAENQALQTEVDRPTPFTQKTFKVTSWATKSSLTGVVDAQSIQAAYLFPMATGGMQIVNKSDTLRARNAPTTDYGNLPRGVIDKYKGLPGVFIGTVKFKDGRVISGVWKRPMVGKQRAGARGTKGKLAKVLGQMTGLTLLIAFNPPKQVKETLHPGPVALKVIKAQFNIEMQRALDKAIATAR